MSTKKMGAPQKGDDKKIQIRISVQQKKIDLLGEEAIKKLCENIINEAYEANK